MRGIGWGWCLLVLAGPAVLAAQARVEITVRDTAGINLPHANIETQRKERFVTDQRGVAVIPVSTDGSLSLRVFRLGYAPVERTVLAAGDTGIEVRMVPIVTKLAEKRVIARRYDGLVRAGFYDRLDQRTKGAGSGTFLTPEDLEARLANKISHVLDKAPGVKLSYTPGGHMIPRSTLGNCNMEIYLDGSRLITEATRPGVGTSTPSLQARPDPPRRSARLEYVDEIVQASSVAAVEIYTHGTSVPPQFQMLNGTCGVIVIWTRTG